MSMILSAATVVADGQVLRPGWLQIEAGLVLAVGTGHPPRPSDHDLGMALVVPGFVDMHVHGGGGSAFTDGADAARQTIAAHRRHGTTTMVASLVSAAPEPLRRQVQALADVVQCGELAGIHLEGPWLAPSRIGAHDPSTVRAPAREEIASLLAAGRGTIKMVTLAPELVGGIDAIHQLVDAGVVVAVGHTNATYAQTQLAINAGATVGTHVFNAMRPIRHREPGPVFALAESEQVTLELINDGIHLHPAVHAHVRRWVGPQRIALVTDAMAAAGMGDGSYHLGALDVTVTSGAAQITGTTTIAGSTVTMDKVFARAITDRLETDDATLLAAVEETSTTPARALELPPQGLRPGTTADLIVLDSSTQNERPAQPAAVMVAGRWANEP